MKQKLFIFDITMQVLSDSEYITISTADYMK